jgi:lambda family phage minor tail protein L
MAEEGKNKVAESLLDLQPTAILELFRVFPDKVNKPTLFLGFHGGSIFDKSITWQGIQYLPLAMEGEGFDIFGDGKLARPKLRVVNKDYIITNFLQNYNDLVNAKIVRKRVSVKYLDS